MERYYTVGKNTDLYDKYFALLESLDRVSAVYRAFAEEQGIEAPKFVPNKKTLGIIPTENDLKTFGDQLRKEPLSNGARVFKQNLTVGRAWVAVTRNVDMPMKPIVAFYLNYSGRFRTHLFDHDGKLYCSIETDTNVDDFSAPAEIFRPIKASEF